MLLYIAASPSRELWMHRVIKAVYDWTIWIGYVHLGRTSPSVAFMVSRNFLVRTKFVSNIEKFFVRRRTTWSGPWVFDRVWWIVNGDRTSRSQFSSGPVWGINPRSSVSNPCSWPPKKLQVPLRCFRNHCVSGVRAKYSSIFPLMDWENWSWKSRWFSVVVNRISH